MYKEVNNNVAGAVKVIGDASYSTRYAFFPCCYDEDRNAWKGVECYEDGTVGATALGLQNAICWKRPESKNLWGLSRIIPNGSTPLKLCLSRCGAMKTVTVSTKALMRSVFTALSPTPELTMILL